MQFANSSRLHSFYFLCFIIFSGYFADNNRPEAQSKNTLTPRQMNTYHKIKDIFALGSQMKETGRVTDALFSSYLGCNFGRMYSFSRRTTVR